MKPLNLLPYLTALVLPGLAAAQTPQIIVQRGQAIPGVGNAGALQKFCINNDGEWLVLTNTNNPDEDIDEVILRNGFLTLQEGTVVGNPMGASIDEFGSLNINATGDSFWEFKLDNPGSASIDEGLFMNTKLIALEGELLNTPGYGRTAEWFMFNGITEGNDNNQILVGCEVNDPTIAGFSDQGLLLVTTDGNGNILNTIDIVHEGGQVPELGFTVPANGFPYTLTTQVDLNNRGDVIWQARLSNAGANDRAVFVNDKVILREGDNSPLPGFFWNSLSNVRVSLNDNGDWLVLGGLNGPQNRRALLVINNEKVVRERETFPAIAPYLLDNFANGTPLFCTNSGEAIYRAQWTGPTSTDTGILLNLEVIARTGVTRLDNVTIDEFIDNEHAIAVSPSGRHVLFECTLEDDRNVIGYVDVGRMTPFQGCTQNEGKLSRIGGFPVVGGEVTFGLDDGQGTGVTPFLLISDRPALTFPPCGLMTNFGELLVDFGQNGNPLLLQIGNPYLGVEVPIVVPIPNSPQLVDQILYAQGIFFDIANLVPGESNLLLTNGIEMEIGAP